MTVTSSITASRKSRSGSNTRKRDKQVKLNLLPKEQELLRELADAGRFQNVQAYIMDRLRPEMAALELTQ